MNILINIAALLVTLGILVTIHEYGHFWVARRCGVRVLRFSIGFGKPLFGWTDRHGTRFVVAAIPLGGYVQMLDEREAPVTEAEQSFAFNRKPIGQRIAIVLAGPVANFLFAIAAYWFMFVSGTTTVVPVIGGVQAESPAQRAGLDADLEIVAIDGRPTTSWDAINLQLIRRLGESGEIRIAVEPFGFDQRREVQLPIQDWLIGVDQPDPLGALGIQRWRPSVPPVLGALDEQGRAFAAGLQPGDRVLDADGVSVEDWMHWVRLVRARPEQRMQVRVERGSQVLELDLVPARKEMPDGSTIGFIGAGVEQITWPADRLREIRHGPLESLGRAAEKTWQMSTMTLDALWKMVEGLVSVKNLSGPVTIARIAGATASSGLESFLSFLAYLSVSLGVLNILPIPVLDGGHLMYYLIELLRGRPVSQQAQWLGTQVGIFLIVGIMLLAFVNDLGRL